MEVAKVITINQPVRVAIRLVSIGALTVSAVRTFVMTVSFAIDGEAGTCVRRPDRWSRCAWPPQGSGHFGGGQGVHRAGTGGAGVIAAGCPEGAGGTGSAGCEP